MIPKVIHYCWFGKQPLPELALKCIASWKNFLPDYEIKEWNESNFDVNIIPYTKEAYNKKKYAFVSDYVRFWVLYNYGGIYFDTDVEIIKPIDSIILAGNFMGTEKGQQPNQEFVNPGLGMGSVAKLAIYKQCLDSYINESFCIGNKLNLKTIVERTSKILKQHGLKESSNIQTITDINIYPSDYFCPIDYRTGKAYFTNNTVSIHHYAASWVNKYDNLSWFAKLWTFFHLPNTDLRNKIKSFMRKKCNH